MALASLWIKVSTQLPRHPKLQRAASNLQISKEELIGRLCLLWIYCSEYRPSGYIANSEELASAMNWPGDAEFLVRGLAEISCFEGFLDYDDPNLSSGFYVHDWEIFNQTASNAVEKRREKKLREEKPSMLRDSKVMNKNDNERRAMPPEVKEQLSKLFAHVRVN